jgi:hypothetical protein
MPTLLSCAAARRRAVRLPAARAATAANVVSPRWNIVAGARLVPARTRSKLGLKKNCAETSPVLDGHSSGTTLQPVTATPDLKEPLAKQLRGCHGCGTAEATGATS